MGARSSPSDMTRAIPSSTDVLQLAVNIFHSLQYYQRLLVQPHLSFKLSTLSSLLLRQRTSTLVRSELDILSLCIPSTSLTHQDRHADVAPFGEDMVSRYFLLLVMITKFNKLSRYSGTRSGRPCQNMNRHFMMGA